MNKSRLLDSLYSYPAIFPVIGIAIAITLAVATVASSVDTNTVSFSWEEPTHLIAGSDCSTLTTPLTPEQLADMIYEITIAIGSAPSITYEVVGNTVFTTPPIPVGSNISAAVGAKRPGGHVACFTDSLSFVIPVPNVGPCSSLIATIY